MIKLTDVENLWSFKNTSILRRRNLKTEVFSETASNVFLPKYVGGFKNATMAGYFGFVFEENLVREIIWISRRYRFRKSLFSKCFPSTLERKADVFKFLRFEERFRKFPFLPPQGFGHEDKTRGGTLGVPGCIRTRTKNICWKSKKCVCNGRSILDLTKLGAHGGLG